MSFPEHLIDRYQRFKFRHFAQNTEHYKELAEKGQKPDVMIVSCSDSRVDPETIFSAMPGELFVVRNVANLVPPFETGGNYHGVSAALEFAVLNLKVKHIVVMGHSSCGGITAALHGHAEEETESRFISKWMSMLDEAKSRLKMAHPGVADRSLLQKELELAGIATSIANLRTFPCVKHLEEKGRLELHGAHFDIGAGMLSILESNAKTFTAI
ncbi:MAG: carbonate dehydratase [Alphaproteobacteria bacterium BRH_c36]|nr:MAG: carbonate dehydratase [Alphaproteobacteria bacterium BRH_c36]